MILSTEDPPTKSLCPISVENRVRHVVFGDLPPPRFDSPTLSHENPRKLGISQKIPRGSGSLGLEWETEWDVRSPPSVTLPVKPGN